MKIKTSFLPAVFVPSIVFIVILVLLSIFLPEFTSNILNNIKILVFTNFSWFFILSVSFFVGFMVLLALSKFGDIKLGKDDDEPSFSFFSWLSMLFATGMGVGLMYFGVAEPIIHKKSLNIDDKEALIHTLFHWGIHPWAIYGVCALAMAYFGFRYKMPLTLRSAFYPFLKDKIYGFWGNVIDILALIVTVFGISTTLGYSASSLNAGLVNIAWLSDISFSEQAIIILIVVSLSTISAISGVNKGLKILSEINLLLAFLLMIFVLVSGDLVELLSDFSSNLGLYFSNIVELSFKTYTYNKDYISWFNSWTVFYWAWWLSWAPFVGFFIAKISRGRTIREFIFGVLIVPTTFNVLWFSVFGNSALKYNEILSNFSQSSEKLLFEFLNLLPFSQISTILALVVLVLFFITSADSGIFVLNSLASGGKEKPYKWQSILWGISLIAIAISLSYSGGLDTILSVTMIVALPFALMLVIMCASLLKGLIVDSRYFNTSVSKASVYWSGDFWEQRLDLILKQFQIKDMQEFLNELVKPAMQKICDKLSERGLKALIKEEKNKISLVIKKDLSKDFIYGVKIEKHEVNKTLLDDENLPNLSKEFEYRPITFFGDDRLGYDIKYLNEKEIIVDILKHYERYLNLLDDSSNEIFTMGYRK